MLTEENVFKCAFKGVEEEPRLVLSLIERNEETQLKNLMNGNKAIAVLGPCGSGKTTLFHRVFSDANRKAWLLGEDLPPDSKPRLVTKPVDYDDKEGAVRLLFVQIKAACAELAEKLAQDAPLSDASKAAEREAVIECLKRAAAFERGEKNDNEAIKGILDELRKDEDGHYKHDYDVYVVLKKFEKFILPGISLTDEEARRKDRAVHDALRGLLFGSSLPLTLHMVVSTDYNVKWDDYIKGVGTADIYQVGGNYVNAGSMLLQGMQVITMKNLGNPDGHRMITKLQADFACSKPILTDAAKRGFTDVMEWSGGNPQLMLCYCSALYDTLNGDRDISKLDDRAQEAAADCLKAWCSHFDIWEKGYIDHLLTWLAADKEDREKVRKKLVNHKKLFQGGLNTTQKELLKLTEDKNNSEYNYAAKRLYDRGILTVNNDTTAHFYDQYKPSCKAIRKYLEKPHEGK